MGACSVGRFVAGEINPSESSGYGVRKAGRLASTPPTTSDAPGGVINGSAPKSRSPQSYLELGPDPREDPSCGY